LQSVKSTAGFGACTVVSQLSSGSSDSTPSASASAAPASTKVPCKSSKNKRRAVVRLFPPSSPSLSPFPSPSFRPSSLRIPISLSLDLLRLDCHLRGVLTRLQGTRAARALRIESESRNVHGNPVFAVTPL
jgi:hypothetical protein